MTEESYKTFQNDMFKAKVEVLNDYIYYNIDDDIIIKMWNQYAREKNYGSYILYPMSSFDVWASGKTPKELLSKVSRDFDTNCPYYIIDEKLYSIDNPYAVVWLVEMCEYMVKHHTSLGGGEEIEKLIELC